MPRRVPKINQAPLHSDYPLRTTQETAAQLQVHPLTLANWRKRHWGPTALRFGSRLWRYRQEDIDLFLGSAVHELPDEYRRLTALIQSS
jgi:hypothetical protein